MGSEERERRERREGRREPSVAIKNVMSNDLVIVISDTVERYIIYYVRRSTLVP
jgi:hypothetical protein